MNLNDLRKLSEELKKKNENMIKRLSDLGLLTKKAEDINKGLDDIKIKQDTAIQNLKALNNKIKKVEIKKEIKFTSIIELRQEIKLYGGIK